MSHTPLPIAVSLVLSIVAGLPHDREAAIAAGQTEPAAIQATLNRVRNDLFSRAERVDDDVRELKEVLALDPRLPEAHLLLGIAYRIQGSEELMGEAVAELRQALSLDPELVPARFYLAHIYLDLGRPARAAEELEAALARAPGNPQFLALLAEAERQQKNPRRSVELARQALQADASFAQARYYLGLALFDLGDRAQAIHELEQVVATGPAVAEAYLSLGTVYIEAGRFDRAVDTLRQGARIDPARPDLNIELARAYRSKGLLAEAERQLQLAQPKDQATLAPSYYRHQQVELDLNLEQGLLRLQRGQLAAAARAFNAVLAMEPDHGPANRGLAEVYLRQGSYARASEHAARAGRAGFPLSEKERRLLQEHLKKRP